MAILNASPFYAKFIFTIMGKTNQLMNRSEPHSYHTIAEWTEYIKPSTV